MADWAKEFYTRQAELGGLTSLPFDLAALPEWHRRRARLVERAADGDRMRILELGSGTGDTAAVLASRGHDVVAVEIVDCLAKRTQDWAKRVEGGRLTVVHGDFYEVDLDGGFDVVCYFDGFGIGADQEQRRLLERVPRWLAPHGCALIDVLTPWYWAGRAGRSYQWGDLAGRFAFDAEECRMLDFVWPTEDETQSTMQSLRCYSPADLRLLLEGTGLSLDSVEGYVSEQYEHQVPLAEAMLYLAKIRAESW